MAAVRGESGFGWQAVVQHSDVFGAVAATPVNDRHGPGRDPRSGMLQLRHRRGDSVEVGERSDSRPVKARPARRERETHPIRNARERLARHGGLLTHTISERSRLVRGLVNTQPDAYRRELDDGGTNEGEVRLALIGANVGADAAQGCHNTSRGRQPLRQFPSMRVRGALPSGIPSRCSATDTPSADCSLSTASAPLPALPVSVRCRLSRRQACRSCIAG